MTTPSSVPFHRPACQKTPVGLTALKHLKQSPQSHGQPCSIPDDLVADYKEFDELMDDLDNRNMLQAFFGRLSGARGVDSGSLKKIQANFHKVEDPLKVAVVGCFNAGKSSLINALVGAKVCETGITPTTMALSPIPYQNGDRIELIDTMGVDSDEFKEHKEPTADEIDKADAVIFVVSANNLRSTGDGFIGEILRACKTPGILVVTHWDQVDKKEDQEAVRQSAEKLANDFFPQQDQRPIFFVNAKNGSVAEVQNFIQTKFADKTNQQRFQHSKDLRHLLSDIQKKVDFLTERSQELAQKRKELTSECEQIEEQYKEESVTKEIGFENERLKSAQEHLRDLKGSRSAIEDLNEKLIEAENDLANAGAASGLFEGALLGAGLGTTAGPAGTVFGAIAGGMAGVFRGDREEKHRERIVQTRLNQKEQEEKTWNSSIKDQEEEVKGHNQELQKLKEQEKQLKEKTDKAKTKVAQQQKEAEEFRQRCLMLIRRLEPHIHTIRERLKDLKCLWGQFWQSSRKNILFHWSLARMHKHASISFCKNMHSRNWKINLLQWGLVLNQGWLWYFPARSMHCPCRQMRKILVKCHVLNTFSRDSEGIAVQAIARKGIRASIFAFVCFWQQQPFSYWLRLHWYVASHQCGDTQLHTPFWNCLDPPRCWRMPTFSTSAASVKRQEFALGWTKMAERLDFLSSRLH